MPEKCAEDPRELKIIEDNISKIIKYMYVDGRKREDGTRFQNKVNIVMIYHIH